MSVLKKLFATAGVAAILATGVYAQTNYVVVTNYVTVTITNFVTITNAMAANTPTATNAVAAVRPATTNIVANNKNPAKSVASATPAHILAKKYPWTNSVSAGLTLARGNTDTTLVSMDYSTTKKTPANQYTGTAGLAYGEQNSVQTADSYKGSMRWDHTLTERLYSYLQADALRDYIADVDYRFCVGPGVGYYLLKQTNTTFAVGGGVNFEGQSLGNQGSTFATMRFADKFEHKINGYGRIWQNVELLPQVDRWDNYLINFELGAEATLTKSFSLKACLDDNFNNQPALNHEKNDVRLVTGIAYKF